MNNKEFASYCKSKEGCYYWFGTFGQKASRALYQEKKKQYPKYYTASDFEKQIANLMIWELPAFTENARSKER